MTALIIGHVLFYWPPGYLHPHIQNIRSKQSASVAELESQSKARHGSTKNTSCDTSTWKLSNFGASESLSKSNFKFSKKSQFRVLAKTEKGGKEDEEEPKKRKQSLFSSVTEALDFSQTRSEEDALLLEDARQATKSGDKMSREQYAALRRKIGGTYKDFFKSYVDVDDQYVEEGWVDKTCKVCKDTGGEARQVDKLGRYVHVACLGKEKSGNFFTRLFSS